MEIKDRRFSFSEVLKDKLIFGLQDQYFKIKLLKLMIIYLSFIFIFIIGAIRFSIRRKHLLLILLSLEFIVLSLFLGLFFYFNLLIYEYYFSLIFLRFRVCEGALGLSLLVRIIRSHGNDYFQTFNILW